MRTGLVVCVLVAGAARADETLTTWGLRWNAPEGCIQAAELAERIERKSGKALFAAQARRHLDGYLALEPGEARRVRFTLLDDSNRVLGTREISTVGGSCHDLDERIALVVLLLIEPYTPKPPPPKAEPKPVVVDAPRLEVRGDERYANSVLVSQEGFYRLLGRRDLMRATSSRHTGKLAGFAVGGVAAGVAVVLLAVSVASSPKCFSEGVGCEWYVGAAVSAGVALITLVIAGASSPWPTSQAEDVALAADFNAKRVEKQTK